MEEKKQTICVLISCMNQHDYKIVERSKVQTDCVVVNQCDKNAVFEYDFQNKYGKLCHVKFISTTERGLSKSRNMALRNATADICQICDDDEELDDDYEEHIIEAYQTIPEAAAILFKIKRNDGYPQVFPNEATSLSMIQLFKSSSQQITFRKQEVNDIHLFFDEKMGSGTGNGGGEEVKFLLNLKRANKKVFFYPALIAAVNPGESQWFHGCDKKFIRDKGWSIRRTVGPALGMIYNIYFVISHRKEYISNMSMFTAFKEMCIGWNEKR